MSFKKWAIVGFAIALMMFLAMTSYAEEADIVDTAIQADDFEILVQALQQADLVDALREEGPFTVFAPTDGAFAALLDSLEVTAEELLDREDLADILLYHVVSGKVLSTDLTDGMEATTLQGQSVVISLDPVRVNDASVVTADIEASNGVIHVIDAVLLPVDKDTPNIPQTGSTSIAPYLLLVVISGFLVGYFVLRAKRATV